MIWATAMLPADINYVHIATSEYRVSSETLYSGVAFLHWILHQSYLP